jgi:alanine-glyoxylate transaminase/(R)-3-amino-2-methylpropionate-pyruvate transaminase
METLQHATTIYLNDQQALYCHELTSHLPKELSNVYLVNSGSEANDLAVFMSRLHTGNHAFVALRYCYHGGAGIAHDITSLGNWKFPLPNVSGFEKVTPSL